MKELNKVLFPFWLAFAITIILFNIMEHIHQNEFRCRYEWQRKGVEIKSMVDSCAYRHRSGLCVYFKSHFSPIDKWGSDLYWSEMSHLDELEGIVSPNDSIYKPAGSSKYYIYKKGGLINFTVVEDNKETTPDDWACKDCKDYYEMFNQSKK